MYDADTTAAVSRFQSKYASKVLTPWGLAKPTGWWYESTKKQGNDVLGCFAPVRLDNGVIIQ